MQAVLITGVSSGIGHGAARRLLERGYQVFGSVRRLEDAAEFETTYPGRFQALVFDQTDTAAIAEAARKVKAALGARNLTALINNAGVSISGPFIDQSDSDFRRQIEINLMGPVAVIRAMLPLVGLDPVHGVIGAPGKIINISSIGAHLATPFMGAYNASKAGLEAFSHSLRRELLSFGIDVVVVVPGAFKSAITAKHNAELKRYGDSIYAKALKAFQEASEAEMKNALPGEAMGDLLHDIIRGRKKKAIYPIMPNPLRDWTIATRLPYRVVDQMILKRLGFS